MSKPEDEDLLRKTVPTEDETGSSEKSCSKTQIIIIAVVAFILIAAGVTVLLIFLLRDKKEEDDDDDGDNKLLEGLLDRRFPEVKNRFRFKIEETNEENYFEISSTGTDPLETKIKIKGNNKLSIASGLGYYLRYYALSQVSWTGDNLENIKNKKLPPVDKTIKKVSKLKYSYYMNVCTHSYSAAWWDWKRWEKEIDWMALNGINLPLAFTGLEYVTKKVFKEFNFTDDELRTWFTGPAFTAWYRMGNINSWGGPMPEEFINDQHDLQLKILERERDYGMIPVLSMFTGYVPPTIKDHFPNANITEGSNWAGFNKTYRTYMLEVTDPLFNQIAKKFIEIQTEVYGTSHIYNGDVYNEMLPRTNDTEYLKASAKGTFEGIRLADPEAIWLMQGWLFINEAYFWHEEQVEAYLSGVPNDGMIILDLFTEYSPAWSKFQNYYGKPWIWCALHNFGGTPSMWGNLTHALQKPQEDIVISNGTMVGIGITMEAIDQNYVFYEAVLENKWLEGKVENITKWVEDYSSRRYGYDNIRQVKEAWDIMRTDIYYAPTHNVSRFEQLPSFVTKTIQIPDNISIKERYLNVYGLEFYGTIEHLWKAWGLLLEDEVVSKLSEIDTYKHDVVDLGVNILTNEFEIERKVYSEAYNASKIEELEASGRRMLELLQDADKLLATDKIYLLGRWVNNAINLAPGTKYQDLFEMNAKNLITLWGPDGNINDYAQKSWADLYLDYYYPRWNMFIDQTTDALLNGTAFDYEKYKTDALNFGREWYNTKKKYASEPIGDTATIAKELYAKYKRI